MNKIWSIISLIILMTLNLDARSQNAEMADIMREDGKIYVVVGIFKIPTTFLPYLLLIFLNGMFYYCLDSNHKYT